MQCNADIDLATSGFGRRIRCTGKRFAAAPSRRRSGKLGRIRDCRAELAHDNAGGFVGDVHRVFHRRARRQQSAERRDDGVAGA